MINWSKYFDHIFILSRCSNFERREKLNQELKRVGLYDYITYLYQPDSKLLNYNSSQLSETAFRCKNAHYNCCKMSYELNYNNICIIEDDIKFLKSLDKIEEQLEIFEKSKNNSDIYLFDYIFYNELFGTNTYYNDNLVLGDFYYLNRRGMKYLIFIIENFPNIMNDSIFFLNLKYTNNYYCIIKIDENIKQHIQISQSDNVLPININYSPVKIVTQYSPNNNDIYNYYNTRNDLNLYNI